MNLNTSIDFDMSRFFQWWGEGLAAWLPEKVQPLFNTQSSYSLISTRKGVLYLSVLQNGEERLITQLDLSTATTDSYQQLCLKYEVLQKSPLILRLDKTQALAKILYLPLAAKDNLTQMIAYEMDKYTPFSAENVYFDVQVLDKKAKESLKVLLVVTPKVSFDPLYQQLNSLGIIPNFVDYVSYPNNYKKVSNGYNLLPEQDKPTHSGLNQVLIGGLSLLVCVLVVAALIFPVWKYSHTVDSLRQQLSPLKKTAFQVNSQQLEMDTLIEETVNLIKEKQKYPPMTELLESLSQLIPMDTWLTSFKYNNKKLQIQGQSPNASILIGLLEASPLFNSVRFVSSLTQDKKTGNERFQISMNLTPIMSDDDE